MRFACAAPPRVRNLCVWFTYREPFAFAPQALGGGGTLRVGAGTDRPAVAKIFAGDAGYLGRTREIDDGLGAFLRRLGAQRHGHPHHKPEPVIVALAETGGDEPRVQAVGGDAGAGEPARKLAGEEDISQLSPHHSLRAWRQWRSPGRDLS